MCRFHPFTFILSHVFSRSSFSLFSSTNLKFAAAPFLCFLCVFVYLDPYLFYLDPCFRLFNSCYSKHRLIPLCFSVKMFFNHLIRERKTLHVDDFNIETLLLVSDLHSILPSSSFPVLLSISMLTVLIFWFRILLHLWLVDEIFNGFCLFYVDLLSKDHHSDNKFTINTYSPIGVVSSIGFILFWIIFYYLVCSFIISSLIFGWLLHLEIWVVLHFRFSLRAYDYLGFLHHDFK